MLKLDAKDRKALYYLSEDARMSDRQLAKKIGLSKNSVKYRLDRLQKEGVLVNFTCSIHLGAVGLDTFCLMLKFKEDIYEHEKTLDYFKNHKFSNWAISLSGDWDIFAEFVYSDLFDGKRIINEIINDFGQDLLTYRAFFSNEPIKINHLVADAYKDLKLEPHESKPRTNAKIKLDYEDKILLNLLANDSSASFVKLAELSGRSIDSIRYRIRQLKNSGVIMRFFPEVSLKKIGYTEYLFNLKIKQPSEKKVNQLKEFIKSNTSATYAFFDTFTLNLVFTCALKSSDELDHLARSIRKNYSEILDEQTYLAIKEQLVFNTFPAGLIEGPVRKNLKKSNN